MVQTKLVDEMDFKKYSRVAFYSNKDPNLTFNTLKYSKFYSNRKFNSVTQDRCVNNYALIPLVAALPPFPNPL